MKNLKWNIPKINFRKAEHGLCLEYILKYGINLEKRRRDKSIINTHSVCQINLNKQQLFTKGNKIQDKHKYNRE